MIDVTVDNFEQEVIAASVTTPVLVDFWAPWCGPCQSLGPLLEKIEAEYEGRFKLVKIDSDSQPHLAQAFGVRSIPSVFLLINGQPVDAFAGAIPEGQIKAFLDKHVPSVEDIQAQASVQEAVELAESGDSSAALTRLHEALQANPSDHPTRYQYIELLLETGQLEQARQAWQPLAPLVGAGGSMGARPEALLVWIEALQAQGKGISEAQLLAAIESNKRDFDARFALAQLRLAFGERTQALDELLEIIMRDKTWNNSAARKAYVGILELMTPAKPAKAVAAQKQSAIALDRHETLLDPEQKLVSDYRRRLSMALN